MKPKRSHRKPFEEHGRILADTIGDTMTQQNFKDECDINTIMSKYRENGVLEHVTRFRGQYGELPDEVDYHNSANLVLEAEEMFAALPAKVRNHCDNDPAKFLQMVHDPERRDELEQLGLLPNARFDRMEARSAATRGESPEVAAEAATPAPASPEGA